MNINLSDLLRRPEGKTLEFKRDLSSPDGLVRSIVAFANTAGGIVLVGIEDAGRKVRGVPEVLAAEERLANIVSDAIAPNLLPEIEILSWRRTQVLAAQVFPSNSRPHYVRSLGIERGTYVRVGSTNRLADAAMIDELRRHARGQTFDEEPVPNTNSEAIDFRAASELFASQRTLRRGDLESLRLVTRFQGRKVATVGGILLFGMGREERFPDAWIQAGRFRGTDRSNLEERATIKNHLPLVVDDAMNFVRKHMQPLPNAASRARRADRWLIPPIALREAIVNAVAHTDYSQSGAPIRIAIFDDRVEVENPGLLPFGLTIEDLPLGISKLRNRVIGRVFEALGLVEQWGSGIQRMTNACIEAGLPPPKMEEIGGRFRVTLFSDGVGQPRLDETDTAVVAYLEKQADGATTANVAEAVGRSSRSIRNRLIGLVERGIVREVGSGPTDPKRRYFLAR